MKRNPEAVCGNCPYFDERYPDDPDGKHGWCKKTIQELTTYASMWCGEHPDFELKDEDGLKYHGKLITCQRCSKVLTRKDHADWSFHGLPWFCFECSESIGDTSLFRVLGVSKVDKCPWCNLPLDVEPPK